MKKNLTEMVFILDKSGSMSPLKNDTIGGFNTMIEEQKKEAGEAYVTTVLFSHNSFMLHNHVNVNDVEYMTLEDYKPMGSTALYDAVGKTIDEIGERLAATHEDERPEKVIFVIVTDGYENSSGMFTKAKVKEMIEHQRTKYNWTFMFLGANIDASAEAESIGITPEFSKKYAASGIGTQSVYTATSDVLSYCRGVSLDSYTDLKATSEAISCVLNSVVE